MVSLINKQLLLTAYAYLFIMEQMKAQQGSEAIQLGTTYPGYGPVPEKTSAGFAMWAKHTVPQKSLENHTIEALQECWKQVGEGEGGQISPQVADAIQQYKNWKPIAAAKASAVEAPATYYGGGQSASHQADLRVLSYNLEFSNSFDEEAGFRRLRRELGEAKGLSDTEKMEFKAKFSRVTRFNDYQWPVIERGGRDGNNKPDILLLQEVRRDVYDQIKNKKGFHVEQWNADGDQYGVVALVRDSKRVTRKMSEAQGYEDAYRLVCSLERTENDSGRREFCDQRIWPVTGQSRGYTLHIIQQESKYVAVAGVHLESGEQPVLRKLQLQILSHRIDDVMKDRGEKLDGRIIMGDMNYGSDRDFKSMVDYQGQRLLTATGARAKEHCQSIVWEICHGAAHDFAFKLHRWNTAKGQVVSTCDIFNQGGRWPNVLSGVEGEPWDVEEQIVPYLKEWDHQALDYVFSKVFEKVDVDSDTLGINAKRTEEAPGLEENMKKLGWIVSSSANATFSGLKNSYATKKYEVTNYDKIFIGSPQKNDSLGLQAVAVFDELDIFPEWKRATGKVQEKLAVEAFPSDHFPIYASFARQR